MKKILLLSTIGALLFTTPAFARGRGYCGGQNNYKQNCQNYNLQRNYKTNRNSNNYLNNGVCVNNGYCLNNNPNCVIPK